MSSIRLFLMLVGVLWFTSASAADREPPALVPITPVGPGLHLARLFNDHEVQNLSVSILPTHNQ